MNINNSIFYLNDYFTLTPLLIVGCGYLVTLECGLLGVRIIFRIIVSLNFPSALVRATGYIYVRMLADFLMMGPRLSLTC